MTYSINLEVYQGPLDLLLELVCKHRLEVGDISISTITDEYLDRVKSLGEMDLDLATSFLVLAATLLELKSFRLLPGKAPEDPELAALLEARDRLLHKLIEYSTFKLASADFAARLTSARHLYHRTADLPPELAPVAPDPLEGMTAGLVHSAAVRILSAKPAPAVDTSHVTPITVTVEETVIVLAEYLKSAGPSTFGFLTSQASSRIEVIMRFLAILQMFKDEAVDLEQSLPFEEIVVRWRSPR